MSPAQPRSRRRRQEVTNTASDNAFVGVQGTVIGDVRYEVKGEDLPERKFEVARNCLAGRMSPRAKQLIDEAIGEGLVTPDSNSSLANEVAYYLTIAVLSDQTFELLTKEEFADLERARWLCQYGPDDEWRRAVQAVTGLIAYLQDQERSGGPDSGALDAFYAAFDRLLDERRAEIRRHLDLILNGVIQDRLDASLTDVMRGKRTADNRDKRVWKFFEPVPEAPRPKALREHAFGLFERTATLCGGVLGVAGMILALRLIAFESVKVALIIVPVVLVAGTIVAFLAPAQFPARYSALHPKRPRPAPTEFGAYVKESVQRQFDKQMPWAISPETWRDATRQIRTLLAEEIIDLYSEPEVAPGAVDWLIAWHAWVAARKWSARELIDTLRPLKLLGLIVGATGLVIGCLVALVEMLKVQPGIGLVAVVWLMGGVGLLAWSHADVRLVWRFTYADEKAAAERLFTEENDAFRARCAVLADRPNDAEMAQWLDYDKMYLKTLAMNQYGLASRDVIAHATLTEAGVNARRARVAGGQPRFSSYLVWVFLLTKSGARQVAVHLDFPTGIASDQDRTAFRYDAIASARVAELGVRFDDGRREIILPRTDGEAHRPNTSALIFYQEFHLSLTNGQQIAIKLENFDATLLERLPDGEEPRSTPDLSDLTGALSLLEAVAADGRKWIEQARIRHGHRPLRDDRTPRPTGETPGDSARTNHTSDSTAN